jgi:hypothetical protein
MKIKKFIVYLLVVIFGVVIIDVVSRIAFTPYFEKPPLQTKAGAIYKFAAYEEPANLIILGASRATHHYRSEQIEDSLNISVYNYGGDGRCSLYQYLCLLKGLSNGGLKIVILDLSSSQLSNEWVNDRISDLYPYYWINDTVRHMVDEVENRNMSWLMLSSLIQYNSQYLNMIAPMPSSKGYIPLPYTGKDLNVQDIINNTSEKIDNNEIAIKYINKMAEICTKENIRFIICLSPSLNVSKNSEEDLESLCKHLKIECWNKTHSINNSVLFRDFGHLNDKGATIFTEDIIQMLK